MEFDCKLAHVNRIEKISAFNSIRELYIKIGQTFSISPSDILFCTLNNHDFADMDNILGNYLSLSDLIIAHLCGERRELDLVKDNEFLGLTITDNGDGRAFVKKVKPGSSIEQLIKPGDHIEMINSKSMVGLRHHEVAMALKDMPINSVFTIKLIEPLIPTYDMISCYKILNPNNKNRTVLHDINQTININSSSTSSTPTPSSILSATTSSSSFEDLAKSSLPIERLLSTNRNNFNVTSHKGIVNQSNHHYLLDNHYRIIIDRIESQLESFLGINDTELAIQIYRLLEDRNNENIQDFMGAIRNSDLKIFDFSKDFMIDLWDTVTEYRRTEEIKNENSTSELI